MVNILFCVYYQSILREWIAYLITFLRSFALYLAALLFKGTLFKGEAVPFVMELPNYRMPGVKNASGVLAAALFTRSRASPSAGGPT